MNQKTRKVAVFLTAVVFLYSVMNTVTPADAAAGVSKGTKRYTISKTSGTYTSAVNVSLKAKKGYHIYYSTSGKLKKSKVIKSGKKKVFHIKKTSTLSLYIVKKSDKVTASKLKKIVKNKKSKFFVQYKYVIKNGKTPSSPAPGGKAEPTAGTANSVSGTSEPSTGTNAPAFGTLEPSTGTNTPVADTAAPPTGTNSPATDTARPSGSTEPGAVKTEDPAQETDPGSNGGTGNPEREKEKAEIQTKINEWTDPLQTQTEPEETMAPAKVGEDTPTVRLTKSGIECEKVEDGAVTYESSSACSSVTINEAGTYRLTGGTSDDPIKNVTIAVAKNISDPVHLIWDDLHIDNSQSEADEPVVSAGKATTQLNITLKGTSVLKGSGRYKEAPATAIINASDAAAVINMSAHEGEEKTASLTVVDSMPPETDFGANDPSDGIFSKGKLVLNSGIYNVTVNGDCLKGTGKDGTGGIVVNGGVFTLCSHQSNAMKSKNGNIVVRGGEIKSTYTKDDAINAKNYNVVIKDSKIEIDHCYGDGIQGENVGISGDATDISIRTYFENAGVNYYDTSRGSGNYNTMTTGGSTKTETVQVDTGSHKGIKGGTKACSYSYTSVEESGKNTAGTVYTKEASGGIVITGGNIHINTSNAGIKYNGGMGGMGGGFRPGQGGTGSSGLTAANNDGQYIIGSPDDAVHSNNTCVIAGGSLDIVSSDDAITAARDLMIMNGCDIAIRQCYEGIEAGTIIIGAAGDSKEEPTVKIYSNDDGINASSKTLTYVYADESEEKYTKRSTSSANNTFYMLSGYLNIMIADDQTHSFSLGTEDGNQVTGTYSADGDGIDCNGSFYAHGGTIIIFGTMANDNSPVDTDQTYYIGRGATLLAVGSSGMIESPTETGQAVISYPLSGGLGQRPGQMFPGQGGGFPGGGSGSTSFGADTPFAILDAGQNVLLSMKPIKAYSYVLYSAPELTAGSAYTLYSGGGVSGTKLNADSGAYDYRFSGYDTSGADTVGTVTAK